MKHLHTNQEFRFNEVLFEHRNKEYGAYVLRNESDRILTKALFVGVSLLAAISITPLVISAFRTPEIITDGGFVLPPPVIINDTEDPPVQVVKPVQPVTPPNTKQYDSSVPTPVKDAIEPAKITKPADAAPGLINNPDGESVKNTYIPPAPTIGNGPIAPPVQQPPALPKNPGNSIADQGELSVEANFVGGIDSFRNKVMNNFDGSGFETGGIVKTTITFIVEIDGTISGIKANGTNADFNSEAMRTIKSIRGKWVPGKNKQGQNVRSYFKFPISMKFE
ncbi:energy transducer TonB [Chryseobacterium sp. T16E-39]|uniref:energy transducer TonB n=1 Tax=Chryseobacterium sp. T16E-39 TaxID=2015076 RepID=UPI000B5B33ED|nr:energy transducer TonB [Chryseobacterium sp. T16E-39]ASK32215.1 energy transducer TonB [Chryseobacterium sp. T16E-39]